MKEFLFIFRLNRQSDVKPSPEQIKERIKWLDGIAAQNKLADKGNALSPVSAKTIQADQTVTDGPFTEVKEFVSGYMTVSAETIDEAVELAKTNPVFKLGGSIEVREIIKLYGNN